MSIIICVYNGQRYVRTAIESILSQSYPNIELIIINDGSTDSSPQIINEFKERAIVVNQENIGQPASLNKGWSLARGEIVGYLSDDDFFHSNAIKELVLAMSDESIDICYPNFDLIDPNSKVIREIVSRRFCYSKLIRHIDNPIGPGVLFRKKIFENFGGWREDLIQMPDLAYWLKVTKFCNVQWVNKNLAAFRVHNNSQTFEGVSKARADEVISIIDTTYNDLDLSEYNEYLNESKSNALFISGQLHLRAGRYIIGISRFYRGSLLFWKNSFSMKTYRMLINGLINRKLHSFLWSAKKFLEMGSK
ncbi:MAG: glycosyltransferase [Bacteriovoracaceae bacterium]|nr:glycosyltransferase [Bacteriovoracaceae bacterium]